MIQNYAWLWIIPVRYCKITGTYSTIGHCSGPRRRNNNAESWKQTGLNVFQYLLIKGMPRRADVAIGCAAALLSSDWRANCSWWKFVPPPLVLLPVTWQVPCASPQHDSFCWRYRYSRLESSVQVFLKEWTTGISHYRLIFWLCSIWIGWQCSPPMK
jgi:hypothetical protein